MISFPEPLDRAMLDRLLTCAENAKAGRRRGIAEVDDDATLAVHARPALAGGRSRRRDRYDLEDLAGNSIGRPFEVDAERPIEVESEPRPTGWPPAWGPAAPGRGKRRPCTGP